MTISNPTYQIGDPVYHCTKESPEGVVINCHYNMFTKVWRYEVAFAPDTQTLLYLDQELSSTKRF